MWRPINSAALLDLVRDGVVSSTAAKTIFAKMFERGEDAAVIADREGLRQVGDDNQLVAWIEQVLSANPEERSDLRRGRRSCLGFWWGR